MSRRPVVHPGDHVLTPTGRLAVVERLLPEGRVSLAYENGDAGRVTLPAHLLKLVSAADAVRMSYRA